MSKFDRVRSSFSRAHDGLFDGQSRYEVTLYNYDSGSYDPNTGEVTGESRTNIGSADIEIVPPAIDSTVRTDGTSFSWDTSARLPEDDAPVSDFIPLGEDNERPTEVELTDTVEDDTTVYQLHGYKPEYGSGMVMLRLVEL